MIRTERTRDDYLDHTHISHIYAIPDTYIGSVDPDPRVEWAFDGTNNKMVAVTTDLPLGAERVFLEILSNAGDNADASRRMGVNPGQIHVTCDNQWIRIRNEGEPIPVQPHKRCDNDPNNLYMVVTHIFSSLLSSSNYDTNIVRMGCGRNGYGSKLTNIFSKDFRVEVGDPKHGQHYRGRWVENMTQFVEQTVTPGYAWNPQVGGWQPIPGPRYNGSAYVEVSWNLDFARFRMNGYSPEALALFHRYTLDFSLSCRVPVTFNGKQYDVRAIRDYARLCWGDEIANSAVLHCEWDKGVQPASISGSKKDQERKIAAATSVDDIPIVEVLLLDTPDNARVFSFVNGLMTVDGGAHVKEVYAKVTPQLVESINAKFASKFGKKKKGRGVSDDKDGEKNKDIPHLTMANVKPHLSLIVNCRLPNPKYSSQSKRHLDSPKPSIVLTDAFIRSIGSWSLFQRLEAELEAKAHNLLKKTDGKKKKHVSISKGEDADDAGGVNSQHCVFYIVEGRSASGYPKTRIQMSPGGKDRAGYYPLQGKFANVSSHSEMMLLEYTELNDIKAYLGLEEGVDYTKPENRAKLRYGFIVICTDADSDGKHILTLLLNLFHRKWPSLLQLGIIGYLMTPAVRLYVGNRKGRCVGRFSSDDDYKTWLAQNRGHKYFIQYYKGLGTSNAEEKKEDYSTAVTILCFYDGYAPQHLELGFNPKCADQRKEWMARWRGATRVDEIVPVATNQLFAHRSITHVVNNDLLQYSIDSLFRAIPSFRDGLKKSQRQALYWILSNWNFGHSEKPSMKVARIANAAAEKLHYHHAEKSLMDTIIQLAQSFIGSNNLNLLEQQGEFGTRDDGGADAADGRYSETCPEWWLEYVFQKEMVEMISKREVEGHQVEPIWLPCDVPLVAINGTQGVATGWSTYIPPHNPYNVIDWLLIRMHGQTPPPLIPWFKDFRGTLEIKVRGKKRVAIATEESSSSDDEDIPGEADPLTNIRRSREEREEVTIPEDDIIDKKRRIKGRTLITRGLCEVTATYPDGTQDLHITELPIGRWMAPYRKEIAEKAVKEKRIHDFKDNATATHPNLRLFRAKDYKTPQSLKLIKSYGLANMVLIDDEGFPRPYETVETMMEAYFQSMLQAYESLRKLRIDTLTEEIRWLSEKRRFARLLVTKIIVLDDQEEDYVYAQMRHHQFDPEMFDKLIDKVNQRARMKKQAANDDAAITRKMAELTNMKETSAVQMWSTRLIAFREALIKRRYPAPDVIDPSKYVITTVAGFSTVSMLAP